jgi:SpoVK/Ycf46/Vps4 family AAA+-type ATPase
MGAEEAGNLDETLNRHAGIKAWYQREERFQLRLQRIGQPYTLKGHFLFLGNPGTGKTTAANALGKLCERLKITPGSSVVVTTPSTMQTGYVGQAGGKARQVLETALGGVLLVDEAYTMCAGFGREVLDEMVAALEEVKFKGRLLVILAGYEDRLLSMLDMNEGAKSRFPNIIRFPDFTAEDCARLFLKGLSNYGIGWTVESGYNGDAAAHPVLLKHFSAMIKNMSGWANGRDVLSFVEHCAKEMDEDTTALSVEGFAALATQFTASRAKRPGGPRQDPLPEPELPTATAEAPGHNDAQRLLKTILATLPAASADPAPDSDTAGLSGAASTFAEYSRAVKARLLKLQESSKDEDKTYVEALEEELRRVEALKKKLAAAKDAEARRIAEQEAAKEAEELKLKMKLAEMSLCPAGFAWHREGAGWRCDGGSHTVSDQELQRK